jgi:hypothetical protein
MQLETQGEPARAALAQCETKLARLRAERKLLVAEIRRCGNHGSGASGAGGGVGSSAASDVVSDDGTESGSVTASPAATASTGGGAVALPATAGGDGARAAAVTPVRQVQCSSGNAGGSGGSGSGGSGGGGGGSGGSGGSGSGAAAAAAREQAPLSKAEMYDRPSVIKQLSRQLVHLRERQQQLREDMRRGPIDGDAQRIEDGIEAQASWKSRHGGSVCVWPFGGGFRDWRAVANAVLRLACT